MSDASRHAAHFVAESSYGVTPENPSFKRLRHTGVSLGVSRSSLQSEELRPDRQIADFRLGTISVGGDAAGELSYGSYDDFLEAVLMGTWAPKATLEAATLSATNADASFNDSGDGFAGYEVGDVIEVSGFTEEDNNGFFTVASVAVGKLTVTAVGGGAAALVDEAAGDDVTISTIEDRLSAGVTRRSFSILRNFSDIADGAKKPWHLFKGVELNTLAVNINPTAILTATFGTLGREGTLGETAPSGSSFAAAPTTSPLDPFSGTIRDADENVVGVVTEANFTLENGLEVRNVVGSKFTIRPSVGRSNLTGQATIFFEDSDYVSKFIDEEVSGFTFEFPDAAGNTYIFELPRLKFTGGQPDVAGQGSITLAMPFQGIMHPTLGTNIRIRRIPAVA